MEESRDNTPDISRNRNRGRSIFRIEKRGERPGGGAVGRGSKSLKCPEEIEGGYLWNGLFAHHVIRGTDERTGMRMKFGFSVAPVCLVLLCHLIAGNTSQESGRQASEGLTGRLIPAGTTMATAWDIPRDPLNDSTLGSSPRSERIREGYRIFMQTPGEAPKFARNRLSCGNCHLNGGQRERALPLVGVAGVFPEYNKREGRTFSLEDRIVGCFMRSENATGSSGSAGFAGTASPSPSGRDTALYPGPGTEEVTALAEYIQWLSEGIPGRRKTHPGGGIIRSSVTA
jgi:hypothetical protein